MRTKHVLNFMGAIAFAGFASSPGAAQDGEKAPVSRAAQSQAASEQFLELTKRHASLIFESSPEWATQMGVSADIGGKHFGQRLSTFSPQANDELRALNSKLLAELKNVDRDKLGGTAAVTYDVMLSAYELAERQNRHRIGIPSIIAVNAPYSVDQLFGPQVNIPRFFTAQIPIQNAVQLEDYISRLSQIERVMSELATMTEEDSKKGVLPPKFALEAIVQSARSFVKPNIGEHPILTSLSDKLDRLSSVTGEQKNRAIDRTSVILEQSVNPAFTKFADRIETLALVATNEAGVWKLPKGNEIYQIALDSYGANGLTADEIHELGISDVKRIHEQMDHILKGQGYTKGSVGERMNALSQDPKMLWPNTDAAKTEILEALNRHIQAVMKVAPKWFGSIPPQSIEVRKIPVYEEGSAGGAYYTPPSLDGSQPGVFWINLKDTAD